MSIKRKLPIFITLLVAVPIVLLVAIYYPYVSRQMIESNKENIQKVLNMESEYLTSFFDLREIEAHHFTTSPEIEEWIESKKNEYNYTELNAYFEQERDHNPFLRDIFILDPFGIVVASSHPDSLGIDLSDRQYYKKAIEGRTVISNLLKDRVEGESVIFVATPIRNHEEAILGVMGNVVEMNHISSSLLKLVEPNSGRAYMVDQNGIVVFHPDEAKIGKVHEEEKINQYLRGLEEGKYSGSRVIETEENRVFLVHQTIEGTNWIIVMEQDLDLLMLSARRALIFILILSSIILGVSGILGHYFAVKMVYPLNEFIRVMNSTSIGDLNNRIRYNKKDEIGQLANNFNNMLDKLVSAYDEISEKNIRLTQVEDELRHVIFSDQLTGLPNRSAMLSELEERIHSYPALAVFLFDIDQFKRLNDILGHAAGDQVLGEVADRLKEEGGLTYRLSGDEFGMILLKESHLNNLEAMIKKILDRMKEPFSVMEKDINVTVCIGISVFPTNGETPEKLMQNADTAMTMAKRLGKSQVAFFSQVMRDTVSRKIKIEQALKRSIKDGLLNMHFQPKYKVQNRQLVGFESLMRLTLEDGESISPVEFIPIAEDSKLIIELGEWALEFAFNKIKCWMKKGYTVGHIGVNVSAIQLKQPKFAIRAKEIADKYGVSPEYIELEITESILIDNTAEMLQTLLELRKIGYQIALDDFGTGYSAFNYLRTIPLTSLKIDKTFIDHIGNHRKAEALVKQIIDIAHEINLSVVAEGVETKEQYKSLLNTSCDMIQGYYFSKPLPVEYIEELLKTNED